MVETEKKTMLAEARAVKLMAGALDPDADLQASGRHAEVALVGGSYHLRDQSTNGTFINGRPAKQITLADGEVVTAEDLASLLRRIGRLPGSDQHQRRFLQRR